jgi:type IV secretory pathway VirB10-like protein
MESGVTMRSSLLLVFIVSVFIGAPAFAETVDQAESQEQKKQEEQKSYLYQWTDGKGVVHITDNLGKVPKEYRSEAQKLEYHPGVEGTENIPGNQKIAPNTDESEKEQLLEDQKESWKARMKSAKQRLADAELHYKELEQKRDLALQSWGGPASGQLAGREEAARIEQEMNQVQTEIDNARRQIEVELPDEARKAGVPPGWLRE